MACCKGNKLHVTYSCIFFMNFNNHALTNVTFREDGSFVLLEIQFGVFPLDVKLTSLFLTPPQIPIWLQMTMRVGVFILFFLF